MTQRLARLVTGLTGTALTLLLFAGPPWLLTTLVGPPIPTSWPDLDLLRTIATVGVTDTFIVTTLAVIVWIAWAQFATAVVVEALVALRRRPRVRLPLLPGTQPLAARLVAATLLLVTFLQPRPIAAGAPLDLPVTTATTGVIDDRAAAAPEPTAATRTAVQTPTRTVEVGERDSWWSLAETHLGDGIRWRELRELNTGRTLKDGTVIRASTDQLQAGWDLHVPTDGTDNGSGPAADHAAAAADGPDTPDGAAGFDESDTGDTAAGWTVTAGEHFWGKATDTLEQSWNRPPTDAEVIPYWQQLIDTNHDLLAPPGDPDLIHPGQEFELPDPPPDPDGNGPPPADEPEIEPEAHVEVDPDEDDPNPGAGTDTGGDGDQAGPAAPVEHHTAIPDTAVPDVAVLPDHLTLDLDLTRPSPDGDSTGHPASGSHTVLGLPAELARPVAATALAAAGIVALLTRRRRTALQQRATTLRLPTPAPAFTDHLGSLTAATPTDPVLDELVNLLSTIPEHTHPALVLLHDTGPISLVFDHTDHPSPPPPSPWQLDTTDDGPVRWTARLGSRGPRRSIGLPLLLTLGRTDTTTVLANLAAGGTLPVAGPPDQVRTRLRAAALELACSRTAGPLEVVVVGDDTHLDVEQLRYTDDASDAIAAAVEEAEQGIIADDRLPRAIISHDPARPPARPAAVTGFCAAFIAAEAPTDGWHITLDGPTTWLHSPDGHRHPLTSPDLQPDLITGELHRLDLDNAVTTPTDTPEPEPPATPDAGREPEPASDPGELPDRTGDAEPATDPDPWCRINLLGPLHVTLGGEPVTRLTPTVRQLLPYLATHRHGITLTRLEEAIWPGRPPSRNGQRARTALTRLRAHLGNAPDGTPLIPRRSTGDQHIRLTDHITTDLDQALQHLDSAKTCNGDDQLRHLTAALDLIRGEPFEDLCFTWSLDVQQHAITHLHDAALTAATRLRELERYDEAEQAIRQGLTLYDPSEPLYVEWFHLEFDRGHHERIPHLWRRLQQRYADQADETAGIVTTPTIETELAYTNLTRHTS